MLDTHCHLDDARYDTIIDEVESRRLAAGVRVLVPGVSRESWDALRRRALANRWLYAVGTHPERLKDAKDPVPCGAIGAVAIGECGLHRPSEVPMERQSAVLLGHLELARSLDLPVILHCVRAHDVLPVILRTFCGKSKLRGVLHSYSGGADMVAVYASFGLHLSFGGAITWPNARRPIEALRRVSLQHLLLESDGPDQAPRFAPAIWSHGSEPAMMPALYRHAAELRGTAPDTFTAAVARNVADLGWD
jgi:TatD DNase family protein